MSPAAVRFFLEAGFLILLAAAAAIAHLAWYGIILVMTIGWLLVAFVEQTASRERSPARGHLLARLSGRRARAPAAAAEPEAPPPSHVTVVAEEAAPAVEEPPAVEEAEPQPEPETEPVAPEAPVAAEETVSEPAEASQPDAAAVAEPPMPPPELQAVPPPPPEAAPAPALAQSPTGTVIPFTPRGADGPREWNLWELERIVRDHEGADVARDEERNFLLMHLREFANADGVLPETFDPLVRESFGDLLTHAIT